MLLKPAIMGESWVSDNDEGIVIPRDPDIWGYVNRVRMDGGDLTDDEIEHFASFVNMARLNGAWDSLQVAYCANWGKKYGSGGNVETIYSAKNLSRIATVATTGSQPAYNATGMNSKPTLVFDGTDDILSIQNAASIVRNVASATLFAVTAHTAGTGRRVFWISNGLSGGQGRAIIDSTTTAWRTAGRRLDANSNVTLSLTTTVANPAILAAEFDWANSDLRLWANRGTPAEQTTFQTDGNTSDTDSILVRIGSEGTNYWQGQIAAILAFSPKLTLTQRQAVEQFFADFYAITLT